MAAIFFNFQSFPHPAIIAIISEPLVNRYLWGLGISPLVGSRGEHRQASNRTTKVEDIHYFPRFHDKGSSAAVPATCRDFLICSQCSLRFCAFLSDDNRVKCPYRSWNRRLSSRFICIGHVVRVLWWTQARFKQNWAQSESICLHQKDRQHLTYPRH